MARFNRDFLIPYLQDVFYTEAICNRLNKDISSINEQMRSLSWKFEHLPIPEEPSKEYCDDNLVFLWCPVLYVLYIIVRRTIFKMFGPFLMGPFVIMTIIAFVGLLIGAGEIIMVSYRNTKRMQKYKEELKIYNSELPVKQNQIRDQYDALKNKGILLNEKMNSANKIRNQVYSINVIPNKFRNIYAASYLYDYFSSSREDDLDKILQTMLLDEIVQQMQQVIQKMNTMIENQRVQIALQHQQNSRSEEQHIQQMRQLASIEQNQQLQLDYENMITSNMLVTNFILADKYFYERS